MGKYYYVRMVNSTRYYDHNNQYQSTETAKAIEKIACDTSLGSYEPNALSLLGIKSRTCSKREKGFLGIEYEKSYSVDVPIFVICEDNGQFLEEVITGNRYEKVEKNYYGKDEYSSKLKLCAVKEIPSGKVVEILKNLSQYELDEYARKIHELDRAIAIGYQKDMQMIKNDKILLNNDESYIKSFRKKYGK